MSVVSVYCIFGSAEEAERIGRTVVEEGLAACINVLGSCRSVYRWHGEIETAEEAPAILKTSAEAADLAFCAAVIASPPGPGTG